MDWELKAKQLQKENQKLRRQLELATVANGRTKNIRHLLALTNGDVKDDGFCFRGESCLSADAYFERLRQHPDYSPLMGQGGETKATGNPFKRGPSWNLTRQMEIQKSDPSLAARLRKEAGK